MRVSTFVILNALCAIFCDRQLFALSLEKLAAQSRPAVYLLEVKDPSGNIRSTGTGFLVSADGLMLTNHHVIAQANSVTAKAENGARFEVSGILVEDKSIDVALLRLVVRDANYLQLSDATKSPVVAGQPIAVVGSPLGLEGSLSDGIVSAVRPDDAEQMPGYIQITAPISSGSSGSPVLNRYGQVIGMATLASNSRAQNLNFAIPTTRFKDLIERAKGMSQKPSAFSKNFTNSLGMEMIWCPPGKFVMSGDGEIQLVKLTRGFWISRTEVTQAQWVALMRQNPANETNGPDAPVDNVSWTEAMDFCRRLSATDDGTYTLPTEAQWEYACRAGTNGLYAGNNIAELGWTRGEQTAADVKELVREEEEHIKRRKRFDALNSSKTLTTSERNELFNLVDAIQKKEIAAKNLHPVGRKMPNPWGICDMHGNVREWCLDWYAKYPFDPANPSSVVDPTGPESGKEWDMSGSLWFGKVVRGGSADSWAFACSSGRRFGWCPRRVAAGQSADGTSFAYLGFRPVRLVSENELPKEDGSASVHRQEAPPQQPTDASGDPELAKFPSFSEALADPLYGALDQSGKLEYLDNYRNKRFRLGVKVGWITKGGLERFNQAFLRERETIAKGVAPSDVDVIAATTEAERRYKEELLRDLADAAAWAATKSESVKENAADPDRLDLLSRLMTETTATHKEAMTYNGKAFAPVALFRKPREEFAKAIHELPDATPESKARLMAAYNHYHETGASPYK